MLRRTAAAAMRATGQLMHWDRDQLYELNVDPVVNRTRYVNAKKIFQLKKSGEHKRPYNNDWGNKFLYRGGEMWRVVDARGMEVEALAEQLVNFLIGRHRPDWKRGQSMGDQIIVLNCRHVAMDDNDGTPLPWRMKPYAYRTGYPKAWGVQIRRADEEYLTDPCRPLWLSVYERIPKVHPINRVKPRTHLHKRFWIEKLHCFADDEHPFKDANPVPLVFPIEAVGSEQYHAMITAEPIPRRRRPQGWKS
ncbi:50S ribosomal protein L13 [Diplonema papillatum]|nr:50S ribosomal protein L13 [Diplonema papillatum]